MSKENINERVGEREFTQLLTGSRSGKLDTIYKKQFKPAYESRNFDEAAKILGENSRLINRLSKEETNIMLDYYINKNKYDSFDHKIDNGGKNA